MAATAWKLYDSFAKSVADGTVDLDVATANTFKCALYTSSLTPAATDDTYSTTYELTTANGYTLGGQGLTSVTLTETAGTTTWDCANIEWVATDAGITARYAVIYHVASSQLIAYSLLDDTPQDIVTSAGNTLSLQPSANGIFTISGGWS